MADALLDAVRHRYGRHFEPADLDEIRRGIRANLQAAERLRQRMKLTNADEPVNSFRALPAARPGGGRS